MVKSKKNKNLARVMRLIWESLESHLDCCYIQPVYKNIKDTKIKKLFVVNHGGQKFHIRVVKEYAEIIKLLADLL